METNTFNYARISGIALLLMALVAGFAYGYALNEIYVPENASLTLTNFLQKSSLYQMMCWSFVWILVLDIVVSVSLYYWLKCKHRNLVKIMAAMRLFYSGILGVAIYHLFQSYTPNMNTSMESIQSSIELFNHYFSTGLILFGMHLFLLGAILWKRKGVPKLFGGLAVFAGICYTLIHLFNQYWPGFELYKASIENILALPMAAGEIALAIWMLVKGKRFSDFPRLSNATFDTAE